MKLFQKKPPWYAAGLAFECQGCGRCCAGPEEGYVWLTQKEMDGIAEFLNMPVGEVRRRYIRKVTGRFSIIEDKKTKDCVFLEPGPTGRQCRIYSVRPRQCRTWPFWSYNLASPTAWAAAGERCPGINRGRLYSFDEIEQRRTGHD